MAAALQQAVIESSTEPAKSPGEKKTPVVSLTSPAPKKHSLTLDFELSPGLARPRRKLSTLQTTSIIEAEEEEEPTPHGLPQLDEGDAGDDEQSDPEEGSEPIVDAPSAKTQQMPVPSRRLSAQTSLLEWASEGTQREEGAEQDEEHAQAQDQGAKKAGEGAEDRENATQVEGVMV